VKTGEKNTGTIAFRFRQVLLYWVYGRVQSNCHVKGEAAALSIRAQRCHSHYFSATSRMGTG